MYNLPHSFIILFDLLEMGISLIMNNHREVGLSMIGYVLGKTASINTYSVSKDSLVVRIVYDCDCSTPT